MSERQYSTANAKLKGNPIFYCWRGQIKVAGLVQKEPSLFLCFSKKCMAPAKLFCFVLQKNRQLTEYTKDLAKDQLFFYRCIFYGLLVCIAEYK